MMAIAGSCAIALPLAQRLLRFDVESEAWEIVVAYYFRISVWGTRQVGPFPIIYNLGRSDSF
jgi:hypothetical protein